MKTGETFYLLDADHCTDFVAEVRNRLDRDGVVAIRNLIKPQTYDPLIAASNKIFSQPSLLGSVGYYRKGYNRRFYDALLADPSALDIILNHSLIEAIAAYVGGECFLAECNLKLDEGTNESYQPLHSDFSKGWTQDGRIVLTQEQMEEPFAVGGVMYLHDTTEGAFCYAMGTHKDGSKYGQALAKYPKSVQENILSKVVRIEGKCGDIVLFDDRGFHGPQQPCKTARTVLIWDTYKRETFGHLIKSSVPVLVPDLNRLSQRQLEWLGLGAKGAMLSYQRYHMRQFHKNRNYRYLKKLVDLIQWISLGIASLKIVAYKYKLLKKKEAGYVD